MESIYNQVVHTVLMMTSLCGTPGTGKTTTSDRLRADGLNVVGLTELIKDLGADEGSDPGTGELIVDLGVLRTVLEDWAGRTKGDIMVEGHLSYLVPASLVLLFRTDPNLVLNRLLARGYPEEKARENAEAEAVSYLLFKCMEREREALSGKDWTELPEGCPVVLETDTTEMGPAEQAEWVRSMVGARKEKRYIDMLPFRPPVVDWIEVVSGWY
jgi:adenylate kinase